MTTSPVGLQVAAVPTTPPMTPASAQPAGTSGGGSSGAISAELQQALDALRSALGALQAALDGAQGISGGGGTTPTTSGGGGGGTGGCCCAQASAGAGAIEPYGANAAPEAPRQDKPKKPRKPKADDAAPASASSGPANAPAGFKLQDPLPGASHTSGFGEVSSIRNNRPHGGYDLAKPSGTTIKAAAPGKVHEVKSDPDGYGYYVTLDHGNGRFTRYAHMASMSPLKVGQTIDAGASIGKVGSTGNSTGPHLHFEVLIGGTGSSNRQDPEPYLKGQKTL